MLGSDDSPAGRGLSHFRRAQPADSTLQNLLGVLSAKLELSSRLPVYEYEASREGHDTCAIAFRRLADQERDSFALVLACLRQHLEQTAACEPARDPATAYTGESR